MNPKRMNPKLIVIEDESKKKKTEKPRIVAVRHLKRMPSNHLHFLSQTILVRFARQPTLPHTGHSMAIVEARLC